MSRQALCTHFLFNALSSGKLATIVGYAARIDLSTRRLLRRTSLDADKDRGDFRADPALN